MTVHLFDSNALIALTTADHVHHDLVWEWFGVPEPQVATCPITEGALVRHQLREGGTAFEAAANLEMLRANTWHHFWPDDLPYSGSMLTGVVGHRQVTDSYLVALAAHHEGTLVTLDKGLAALHPEITLLHT